MPDINEICKAAWDSTKKEHQPAYDTLEQSYKETLINRAGVVRDTGQMEDGTFAAFDSHVYASTRVLNLPEETKEEAPPQTIAAAMPIPEDEPAPEPETPKRTRKKAAPKTAKKEPKPRPVKVIKKTAKSLAAKKSAQKGAKKR